MTENSFFSIITVCFQAEDVIRKTIESVKKQSFVDYEFIIVDGKSTDRTLQIIKEYENDPRIKVVSEPDQGLYDAMNKGVSLASGEYLNFLNAGDVYASLEVLSRVNEFIRAHNKAEMFYGDIIYNNPNGTKNIRRYSQFCSTDFYYLLGDCINHQSLFTQRNCFEKNPFDLKYTVGCYRDWLIRKKKENRKFQYMPLVICEYSLDPDSFSIKNSKLLWSEVDMCIKKYYPLGYPLYAFINLIRRGKASSRILHSIYERFFFR